MTSGAFHSVAVDSIKVEVRQRQKLNGVDVLADSIRRLGLIHPIVIRRDLTLVAGERRLLACKALKWERINCQYVEELDEPTLRAIELEENVKRHDLDFWDTAQAITDYHELRCASDRTWTQARTGDALGLDQSTISQSLKLIREKRNGNQSVINAASFSTARNIIQRQEFSKRSSRRDFSRTVEGGPIATGLHSGRGFQPVGSKLRSARSSILSTATFPTASTPTKCSKATWSLSMEAMTTARKCIGTC